MQRSSYHVRTGFNARVQASAGRWYLSCSLPQEGKSNSVCRSATHNALNIATCGERSHSAEGELITRSMDQGRSTCSAIYAEACERRRPVVINGTCWRRYANAYLYIYGIGGRTTRFSLVRCCVDAMCHHRSTIIGSNRTVVWSVLNGPRRKRHFT